MQIFEDVKGQAEGLLGGIFQLEDDPSTGPLEQVSEMVDSVVSIGKNIFTGITTAIGLPSIEEMYEEQVAEFQAADKVCDTLKAKGDGMAQSVTLPNAFGASVKVCISPEQLGWMVRPENLMETGKIMLSCGIEEMVSEPADFILNLGKIIQSGNFEELSGWVAGALSGEALPIAHPIQLWTLPAQFAACTQAKVAVKQGKMSEKDLKTMVDNIYKETDRDTGLVRNLLNDVGL